MITYNPSFDYHNCEIIGYCPENLLTSNPTKEELGAVLLGAFNYSFTPYSTEQEAFDGKLEQALPYLLNFGNLYVHRKLELLSNVSPVCFVWLPKHPSNPVTLEGVVIFTEKTKE